MPSKIPITTLRIKEPDYTKIRIIAEKNDRTLSKEIEYICKQHIAAYEAEHGEIILPDQDPDQNVDQENEEKEKQRNKAK